MDPMTMMLIAGGASAGGGILQSLIGSSAARKAQGGALGQLDLAQQQLQINLNGIKALYAPFIAAGTNSLGVLQGRIMSATERKVSLGEQRMGLETKIAQLSKPTDWDTFPILTGEMASERRASMFTQTEYNRKQQLKVAQDELAGFQQQQSELAPLYEKQDQENALRMGRITTSLDRIHQLADLPTSLADIRSQLQTDPVYQFRVAEGERSINRAAAARGQYFSGAAMGKLSDFSLALTGEETDKFMNRQMLALQGAIQGLGAELGEQQQGVGQALSLANLGMEGVQGTAQAILGTGASQAQLSGKASDIIAQTTMAQGQAQQQGIGSVMSTLGGLSMMSLLAQPKADVGSSTKTASNYSSVTGGASSGGSSYSRPAF